MSFHFPWAQTRKDRGVEYKEDREIFVYRQIAERELQPSELFQVRIIEKK